MANSQRVRVRRTEGLGRESQGEEVDEGFFPSPSEDLYGQAPPRIVGPRCSKLFLPPASWSWGCFIDLIICKGLKQRICGLRDSALRSSSVLGYGAHTGKSVSPSAKE